MSLSRISALFALVMAATFTLAAAPAASAQEDARERRTPAEILEARTQRVANLVERRTAQAERLEARFVARVDARQAAGRSGERAAARGQQRVADELEEALDRLDTIVSRGVNRLQRRGTPELTAQLQATGAAAAKTLTAAYNAASSAIAAALADVPAA